MSEFKKELAEVLQEMCKARVEAMRRKISGYERNIVADEDVGNKLKYENIIQLLDAFIAASGEEWKVLEAIKKQQDVEE